MFGSFDVMKSRCLCALLALFSLSSCGDGGGGAEATSQLAPSQDLLQQASEVAEQCIMDRCDELKTSVLARHTGIPFYIKDGIWWARHWTLDWEGEEKYKANSAEAYGNHILSPRQLVMELSSCLSDSLDALADIDEQLGMPQEETPEQRAAMLHQIVAELGLAQEIVDATSLSSWSSYGFDFVVGKDLSNLTIWLNDSNDQLAEKLNEQLSLLADKLSAATQKVLMEKLEAKKLAWSAGAAA